MKLAARHKNHPTASEARPSGVDNKYKRKGFPKTPSEEQKDEAITDSDEMAMTWEEMKSEEVEAFGLNGPSTHRHRHTSAQHDTHRRVDSHEMKVDPQPSARLLVSSDINALGDAINSLEAVGFDVQAQAVVFALIPVQGSRDEAQGWVKQICKFQYQYARALWERGHWLAIDQESIDITRKFALRKIRSERARKAWRGLYCEGENSFRGVAEQRRLERTFHLVAD